MITRKICLLGAFAVGKTSLMRRFVHEVFDERYQSTLGVKIDTKSVELDGETVKLVIWDIEGADPADQEPDSISSRMKTYLEGTDGVLLVADGTRPGTLGVARQIGAAFAGKRGDVPVVLLLNKSDLVEQWQVDAEQIEDIEGMTQCFTTSALSGENVARTFLYLAQKIMEGA